MAEGLLCNRIGKVQSQGRAVIDKLCRHGVATRQYDPGRGQVDRRRSGRHSTGEEARRVSAFASVAVKVEFYGDTPGDTTRSPSIGVGPVTKASPIPTKRSGGNTLNGESESIGGRIGELEGKVCGKGLDIDRSSPEGTRTLKGAPIGKLKEVVAYLGHAIQLQASGVGKAAGEVYIARSTRLNDVGRAGHRTLSKSRSNGKSFQSGAGADGDWGAIYRG